jgi:hypothetical protein
MNKRLPLTLLSLSLFAAAPACKKQPTENPDTATTGGSTDGGDVEPEPEEAKLPPQDPDPAEIAALYQRYLQGDYEAVASEAAALAQGLTADTQVRAHALAASIAALAAAENVPEDAKAGSEQAIVDGDRLGDPEVQQLAHIAHAVYLVRVHEGAAGQAELQAALALGGPYTSFNRLMLGEAILNSAFGEGEEDTQIKHPEKLDEAKVHYEAALEGALPILQGAVHEGLAAIAKYKNDKEAICSHAQEAENLYAANGATEYIREVPSMLAKDGKCKNFKKAGG